MMRRRPFPIGGLLFSRDSGLVYTLSTHLMSTMILLCWTTEEYLTAIYILKFIEMTATNVWSLSSLAVAVLIAFIVQVIAIIIIIIIDGSSRPSASQTVTDWLFLSPA